MNTTRLNPDAFDSNNAQPEKKQGINPVVVGAAAVVGAGAAVGATAFAMDKDSTDPENIEDTDIFATASSQTYHAQEAARQAQEAAKEEPKEEHVDNHNPTQEEIEEQVDDIIGDVDVEAAAEEIAGNVDMQGAEDVHVTPEFAFVGDIEVMYDEYGNEVHVAEVQSDTLGESVRLADVNLDGEFDGIVGSDNEFIELPDIPMNVSDFELQASNHDEYMEHVDGVDIDITTGDDSLDQDMNFA